MKTNAFRFQTSGPSDVKQLEEYIDRGLIKPEEVVCIIGKTEGNGGRNDFTRDLAMMAFEGLFARRLGISREEVTDRIIFSFSGGCEGVVSPHIVVFTISPGSAGFQPASGPGSAGFQPASGSSAKRLAIGIGFTREFRPEEIGRMPQIEETARVIREIVAELKLESNKDVHFVQMKGAIPKFTFDQAQAAEAAGKPIRSDMVYSRAASALGAALALREVSPDKLNDEIICRDWNQYSGVASCSAKPGLTRTEIMVMANSPHWDGDLAINHGVLNDMLDTKTIHVVLEELGIKFSVQPTEEQIERIVAVFAKSEADPRGTIRGNRHTMLTDDDISDTRYSRCILGAVIASVIGDTSIYISTRAEHHGPLGGGTIAIVARQV